MKKLFILFSVALFGLGLSSCNDNIDDEKVVSSMLTIKNVTTPKDFVQSGKFDLDGAGIAPGESTSFTFNAGKGQCLQFVTMYGNSNNLFLAPKNPGILLFDNTGQALVGDVSNQVYIWDNGTRENQAPGSTITHPGTAANNNVSMISNTDPQGNVYVPASDLMKLDLAFDVNTSMFTLTITNISNNANANYITGFSPGAWAISNMADGTMINDMAFYTEGSKSTSALTKLAEMGDPSMLVDDANSKTGIITGMSPAIVVIYTGDVNPIYEVNKKDAGLGLKELAQKGDASILMASLEAMPNVKNVYMAGTAGFGPGEMVQTTFSAVKGDHLAYATMFGYSNDWFFSNTTTVDATQKALYLLVYLMMEHL